MVTVPQEIKTFYHNSVEKALEDCQGEHKVLFMPEVAEARINGAAQWDKGYTTPSIRATGRTKQGNAVVIYAHIPNFLSSPTNIREAKLRGLINHAARIPQEEFQRLVDAEDKQTVWVVDHKKLRKSTSGEVSLKDALNHPQTIPFLGGQARAEQYLAAHAKAYGTKAIGVWHFDDLDEDSPLGRLLYLGNNAYDGFDGINLDDGGRFAGVRNASAENAQKTIATPSIEQILKISQRFFPEVGRKEFEAELKKLYKN